MKKIIPDKEKGYREQKRKWQIEHPEKMREYRRRWNEKNKDYYKEYWKTYKVPRERKRLSNKKYLDSHPDVRRDHENRRRAKELNVEGGHFTEKEWQNLLDQTGHKCLCCGATDKPLQRDHVIPIGPPHSDEITNVQPLCQFCNGSKGIKTIDYRNRP